MWLWSEKYKSRMYKITESANGHQWMAQIGVDWAPRLASPTQHPLSKHIIHYKPINDNSHTFVKLLDQLIFLPCLPNFLLSVSTAAPQVTMTIGRGQNIFKFGRKSTNFEKTWKKYQKEISTPIVCTFSIIFYCLL